MEGQRLYYELKLMSTSRPLAPDDLHQGMDPIERIDAILQARVNSAHRPPSFALHGVKASIFGLSHFRPRLPEGIAT